LFDLEWTEEAKASFARLKNSADFQKQYKAVKKSLGFLAANPKHPSLQTHPFTSLEGPNKEKVFEAYAENDTPGAFRIFWYYGPSKQVITILAIVPHP